MTRHHRDRASSEWFHVMNRAIGRKQIFHNDDDRSYFIRYLSEAAEREGTGVAAYCLMGNHFHLVLHCPGEALSRTMQILSSRYTRTHNRVRGTDGPIFRSRFVSKPILDDRQLLTTTRYIHRNPLELGCRPDGYRWSSFASYLATNLETWLRTGLVLDLAGGPASYRRFVESDLPSDAFAMSDGVRLVPPQRSLIPDVEALAAAADGLGIKRRLRRDAFLIVALDLGLASSERLAKRVGLRSGASVRAAASKARLELGNNRELSHAVELLRNRTTEVAA